MAGKVVEITDANFEELVTKSEKPVLIDLWATWCGPCRLVAPTVEQIAEEYSDKVRVGKVDVDSNRQIAMDFSVRAIPTLLILKGGQEVDRLVGNQNKASIVSRLEEHL